MQVPFLPPLSNLGKQKPPNYTSLLSFPHPTKQKLFKKEELENQIMGLPPHLSVLRLCILLVLTTLAGVTVLQATDSTIYEYLQNYGLPVGLFPKGITEFAIDTSDGRFQVYLPQPCVAKFENQVHYNLSVAGTLTFGQIGDLSGVLAQDLFLWFPVKGIHVDVPSSGLIYFDVGVVDKQFALSLFESPPDCTASDPDDPNFSPRPAYDQFLRNDLWADS